MKNAIEFLDIKRLKLLFGVMVLALGLNWNIRAGWAEEPRVSVRISPDTCTIGDIITYKLNVIRPASFSVAYPTESDTIFSPFEITEIKKRTKSKDDDLEVDELEYSLMAFQTGDLPLPAIALNYLEDRPDAEAKVVEVGGKMIVVQSVLDSASQAMEDIKPIKSAPFPIWLALAVLAGIVVIAGLIYWAYQRHKNRPEMPQPVEEKIVQPYEWALEKLSSLKSFELNDQLSYKTYYTELSDILREFIEIYYRTPAHEQLTFEILQALHHKTGSEQVEKIKGVLQTSDMVKFAKYFPSKIEAQKSLELAFATIEIAKPISEEQNTSNGQAKSEQGEAALPNESKP